MGCCGIAQKFDMTSTPLREICECYGPDSVEIKARPRAFIQLWTGASGSMCDATYTHSSDAFRWADVSIEASRVESVRMSTERGVASFRYAICLSIY